MDWLVKNAQNRDVERQHLNKILQDIRSTLNELEARMSRDSSEEARIRAVVTKMLTTGNQSGINVTYNTTSKAIDFAVKTFTIQLTGAVTGTATVQGLSNVSITTTLNEDIDGVEEAPLDGLSYWRNAGSWVTVPFPLETMQYLVPGGLLHLDEELNWTSKTIVAGDNIIVDYNTDPSQIIISSTSSGGVLPVVTGEVPPVLVYFDDGSLMYAPAEY